MRVEEASRAGFIKGDLRRAKSQSSVDDQFDASRFRRDRERPRWHDRASRQGSAEPVTKRRNRSIVAVAFRGRRLQDQTVARTRLLDVRLALPAPDFRPPPRDGAAAL